MRMNLRALKLSREVHEYQGTFITFFNDEVIQDLISLVHTGKRAGEYEDLEKLEGVVTADDTLQSAR